MATFARTRGCPVLRTSWPATCLKVSGRLRQPIRATAHATQAMGRSTAPQDGSARTSTAIHSLDSRQFVEAPNAASQAWDAALLALRLFQPQPPPSEDTSWGSVPPESHLAVGTLRARLS